MAFMYAEQRIIWLCFALKMLVGRMGPMSHFCGCPQQVQSVGTVGDPHQKLSLPERLQTFSLIPSDSALGMYPSAAPQTGGCLPKVHSP